PNQKILVAVNPIDRLGDLGATVKLAHALIREIITRDQLEIRSTRSSECFNGLPFEIHPLTKKLFSKTELIEVSNLALQIIVSTSRGESYFYLQRKNVKTLSLTEYGFEADPLPALSSIYCSLSLGLSENQIGIYIEPDWETQHQLTTQEMRMQQFAQTSPETQQRVRGDLAQFALYVGYSKSNELRLGFVDAILQRNQRNEAIVFVLPRLDVGVQDELLKIGKNHGAGTVVISDENGETLQHVNEEGRVVRYCIGSFNHPDLRLMIQASEDEMLVAGDISVSEAISANKQFCYEVYDHKKAFAKSMDTLFQSICQKGENPSIQPKSWGTVETYSNQILRILDPALRPLFSLFNQYVCKERNCIPTIMRHVSEMISTIQKQEIIYLYDHPHFDPTELKDHMTYIVSLDQISSMQISPDTGKSLLPDLAGNVYETRSLGGNLYYLIQRPQL
ncbi:MAG: hypothetical protein KDK64_01960, partial [Chlamydiia bacterium]|nr:hypothetical protein [Chlamydiia bacterium]